MNGGDYFYNNLSFTVTRYNGIMATDSTQCVKKSRGRPKVFDRDAALDKAMKLFWQHGYEATSLADLVEATGAKAPTLYAEFTNKEGLFRAVLDRYICLLYTSIDQRTGNRHTLAFAARKFRWAMIRTMLQPHRF